nr:hypothetical protein CFP56_52655 [Quercus suber]
MFRGRRWSFKGREGCWSFVCRLDMPWVCRGGAWSDGADAVQRSALELQRSGRRQSLACCEDAPWVWERRREFFG